MAAIVVGVGLTLSACGSAQVTGPTTTSSTPPDTSSRPAATASTTTEARGSDLAIVVDPVGDATFTYRALGADGERLYAVRIGVDDLPEAFVRLDPTSGQELASFSVEPAQVPDWGLTAQPTVIDYSMTTEGIWLLESETSLRHLALDDLADLGAVDIAAGPKYLGTTNQVDELWVSHMLLLGRGDTFEGATRIDTATGEAVEIAQHPDCGARDTVSSATTVWVSLLCRTQIAATDRANGETRVTGPFPAPATFTLTSDRLWSTYDQIGIVAVTDTATGEILASYDLDLDGAVPTLDETAGPITEGPLVVAIGRPQARGDAPTFARFDPDSGTLLGRVTAPGHSPTIALLDGTAFLAPLDGGLSSFDPLIIDGDVDPATLAVAPASVTRFAPTSDIEREVVAAFDTVFTAENEADALAAIENGEQRVDTFRAISLAAQAFADAETVINSMFVEGDRADITYSVTLDGVPAFVPLAGYLLRTEERGWQLSEETFCDFASAALLPCS